MELDRIEIKNFRSIKDETIKFDHNCMVLLGKNEAGKSNVLKAIAAVFGKYSVSKKDRRKKISNEKIEEYYVQALLKLNDLDVKEVTERFRLKFQNANLIRFKNLSTIYKFIQNVFREFIIEVNIDDNEEAIYSYWTEGLKKYELIQPVYLSGNILKVDSTGAILFDYVTEIFTLIEDLYESKPYNCHYWQYNASNLLPSSVNIEQFLINPSSIPALENIFVLCNREKIKEEFSNSLAEDGDYSNLLDDVSKSVTQTFQKIWKDFKKTQIQLLPDGEDILIKVVNKAKYSFDDRSDGFKKFISILLLLSSKSRANKIKERDIILIDEPDQSLYPTSAQYLRDELLDMSKKSLIVYSTHSEYMIDTNCLDRHIIVEKDDDVTILRKEDKNAPFSTDELLKRAIGAGIFQCLQPKNIIFEGYLDKELFDKYCAFTKREKEFNEYGTVYLGGISGVETLIQILVLANKKFIIVADSDETSDKKRTDFGRNYPEYKKCWVAYADVCNNVTTMEDFFDVRYITEQIIKAGYSDFEYSNEKSAIFNIDKAVNKDKIQKQELKNLLMKSIDKEHIVNGYDKYLDKLNQTLEKL